MDDTVRLPGQFFTTQQLSENRSLTPEGFLLIRNVPIARTGSQVYSAHELPKVEAKDGLIIVERPEEEVFRPETLASYNGKPLTDDHPPVGMLTPDNWRTFARGAILNPRRGNGLQFDNEFMYGDILVTDRDAIDAINAGKKEVSAGYDASYDSIEPGRARCMDIIGNHVALVDKGRCGAQCAVGDTAHNLNVGDTTMAVKSSTRSKFLDRFRSAVRRGNTHDALEAVSEVMADPEALGEIVSDEMAEMNPMTSGGENKNPHHIEVHTHLNGMPAGMTAGSGAAKDDMPAATMPAGEGNGDMASQIAMLTQRMDKIEQLLMSMANEGSETGQDEDMPVVDNKDAAAEIGGEQREWPMPEVGGYTEGGTAPMMPDAPQAKPGTMDQRRIVTGDSSKMRETFVSALSKAETLCPGIGLPTFDSALSPKATFDALCNFRRKTLDAAYKLEDSRSAIDSVIEGRKAKFYDKEWTCDAIAVAFNGAATIVAQKNQHRVVHPRVGGSGGNNNFGAKPPSPAEMNARAREIFKL